MLRRVFLNALVSAITVLSTFGVARAVELNVGDPAPKLEVQEFVKGAPVSRFEKGKVYVVEFWATWCGPCRESIPHLTELQKKYKDVAFIGVSIFEEDPSRVKPFVTQMGDKMDYRVATDKVPTGAPAGSMGRGGAMAVNWMQAATQTGIPTSFVINGEGKIAWIGHPLALEEPLSAIVAGTWDLAKATTEYRDRMAVKRQVVVVEKDYTAALKDGNPKKALGILDAAIAENPKLEVALGITKYQTLIAVNDTASAVEYGKRLVDIVLKDDVNMLGYLAWLIVDPDAKEKPTREQIALALAAAKRADQLAGGKDPGIGDTLAKAYYDSGDVKMALAIQQKAFVNAKGTSLAYDKGFQDRLKMYQTAAQK